MATGRAELAVALHAAAQETTNGTGPSIDLAAASDASTTSPTVGRSTCILDLDVGAVTGTTPTLTVSLETSRDGAIWIPLLNRAGQQVVFAVVATAGTQRLRVPACLRYVRAKWAIGGTASPAFTFAVTGTALLVYGTPKDFFNYGLPKDALVDFTDEEIDQHLVAACDEADLDLAEHFTLPLVSWPENLRRYVSEVAGAKMMKRRGYMPEPGQADVFAKQLEDAREGLKRLGVDGHAGIVDQTPLTNEGVTFIDPGSPARNWNRAWGPR